MSESHVGYCTTSGRGQYDKCPKSSLRGPEKGSGEYLMGQPRGLPTYRMTDHTWHHQSQNSGIHFWLNKDTSKAWPASASSHPVGSEQMRGSPCGADFTFIPACSLMIGIWQVLNERLLDYIFNSPSNTKVGQMFHTLSLLSLLLICIISIG